MVITAAGGSFDTPSLASRSRHRPQFSGSFAGVQRPLAPSRHHQQQHEQQQQQQRPSGASVHRQSSLAHRGATSCVNNEAGPSPSEEQPNILCSRGGEAAPLPVSRDHDFGQRPLPPRTVSSSERSRWVSTQQILFAVAGLLVGWAQRPAPRATRILSTPAPVSLVEKSLWIASSIDTYVGQTGRRAARCQVEIAATTERL